MATAQDVTAAERTERRSPGHGTPPPHTGSFVLDTISRLLLFAIHAERRVDPFFRPVFDAVFRGPLSRLTTALINLRRKDEGLGLAEERIQPGEEAHLDEIITTFTAQMKGLWRPGGFERGGNTKTHGIVRGEFVVRDDLPETMRRGIFAEPKTYRAWVRFSGPRAVHHAGHRRRRLHEHEHQADGRPRPEAPGRRGAHAGFPRRSRRRPSSRRTRAPTPGFSTGA